MSAQLVNVRAGDKLGDRQTFRIIVEADLLGQLFNSQFVAGTQQLFDTLASSHLVYPISQPAVLPGQQAATIDVRASSTGANATVADLVRVIQQLPVFSNVFNVRSIQRLSTIPATSTTPAVNPNENSQQAAANRDTSQQQASDKRKTEGASGLADQAARLLRALLVVVLVVGGAALLVYAGKIRKELA